MQWNANSCSVVQIKDNFIRETKINKFSSKSRTKLKNCMLQCGCAIPQELQACAREIDQDFHKGTPSDFCTNPPFRRPSTPWRQHIQCTLATCCSASPVCTASLENPQRILQLPNFKIFHNRSPRKHRLHHAPLVKFQVHDPSYDTYVHSPHMLPYLTLHQAARILFSAGGYHHHPIGASEIDTPTPNQKLCRGYQNLRFTIPLLPLIESTFYPLNLNCLRCCPYR